MAIAHLGLNYTEFYELSPVEFYWALKYWRDTKQSEGHNLYEAIRLGAVLIVNPQLPRGKKFKTPEEYVKFAWEEDGPTTPAAGKQSVEAMKNTMLSFAKRHNDDLKKKKRR